MIIPWQPLRAPRKFFVKPNTIRAHFHHPPSHIKPSFQAHFVSTGSKQLLKEVIPEAAKKTFKQTWREDTKAVIFTALIALILFSILEGQRWKGAVNEKISQLFHDKILRNQELAAALTRIVNECTQHFASNEQVQQDVSQRLKAFMTSQGPALREALLKEVLHHPEFEQAAVAWARDQAVTVCNDPVTVEAMADLITQATEMPSTQEAVSSSLRDVINQPEVVKYAVDFVSKAMSSPEMKEEMSKASRNAIETISQDPNVQTTLSNTLWSIMRRSMLPRWLLANEDPSSKPTKKSRRTSLVERKSVSESPQIVTETVVEVEEEAINLDGE